MRVIDQVDRHEGSDTMHAAQERVQVDLLLSHIWIFTWQMLRVLGPNVVHHVGWSVPIQNASSPFL